MSITDSTNSESVSVNWDSASLQQSWWWTSIPSDSANCESAVFMTVLWFPLKFCSEKIPQHRLRTVFIILLKKVLICGILCFSKESILQFGTKWNSAKKWSLTKQLTKVVFFLVFSVPRIASERNSKVFLFQKWFRTEFRDFFSS